MSLRYAYCRISTTDQNIERQIIAIKGYAPDIPDNNIFIDKKTGKDFDREQYQEMKVILDHISKAKSGSDSIELIVEELDRLGRNADGIKKELMWFKDHNIIVRILEIPTTLAAVDENNQWVMEMVTNLLIEVYCQTAHCGRGKSHFIFVGLASPIVPYRNLKQTTDGITADCRSLV
ncbi:MAG: recombinase family protein [Eubacterium sp.]|nr:recombinase family protein [Eubacterium sp.]